MSQTTPRADDNEVSNMADALLAVMSSAENILSDVDRDDIEEMPDHDLVDLHTELKELADAVEEVRKEQVEEVLDDRVEPGERIHGLQRIQSHNKYLKEDASTVIMRAVGQGVDYTEFVSVNASSLADVAPDLAEIGKAEYTYYR